jgi:hypothetical protein
VSGVICVIVLCLCNEVWGMTGVINDIVPCVCNEVWGMSGMFYVIARVYVMKFEVCQQCFEHGTIT